MSAALCDLVRAAALDPGASPRDWMRRPEAAAHIGHCPACQDWLEAFAAGEQAWANEDADALAAWVMARTAGVDEVLRDLPLLADMDPGAGFTDRVLMATSRKPAPEGRRARVAAAWLALVRRPRFAWEAAYVATVCWVLVFGNPVGAFEWSASSIGAAAREHLGGPVKELSTGLEEWRASLAPEPLPPGAAATAAAADAVPAPVRAWQAASDGLQRLTASMVDVIKLAWGSVTAWLDWLVQEIVPPPAEPPADSARSPQ
jgi:hypothetical protein